MVAFFGLLVESNGELTGDRVLVDGGGVTEVKVVDDSLSLGLPEVLFYPVPAVFRTFCLSLTWGT